MTLSCRVFPSVHFLSVAMGTVNAVHRVTIAAINFDYLFLKYKQTISLQYKKNGYFVVLDGYQTVMLYTKIKNKIVTFINFTQKTDV